MILFSVGVCECDLLIFLPHGCAPLGDLEEAWSPASDSNAKHLVEVAFDEPVMATELHIYETYKVRVEKLSCGLNSPGLNWVAWPSPA